MLSKEKKKKKEKKYPFKMISDAFHYQEMLSLDALSQYYINAELHITKLNWLPGVFASTSM